MPHKQAPLKSHRLFRRYKIVERDIEFARVKWQEKWVSDPDNYWHFNHDKGWIQKSARITLSALCKRYSKQPPREPMNGFRNMSKAEVDAHNERVRRSRRGTSEGDQELRRDLLGKVSRGIAAEREIPLHNDIIKYCRDQWPRWKYIHANPSVKSTIQKGAQDFTIFLPSGRVLCIECKAKDGKRDEDQNIWEAEMRALGHTVHLVRSMDEFKALL